ncbi:MAG TPA: DUF445 family protein [Thermosynergistes sp.]|nr:DUF445 family protein [Thermosynergistes sp.]HPZ76515.1 DUF445 family protein [Thermosynergistes sp.]HQE20510.1 DUF445 family protein [Thermosynergistes sp.]HXK88411.1 DUF445 family protein [Thermosynergistes sp.]
MALNGVKVEGNLTAGLKVLLFWSLVALTAIGYLLDGSAESKWSLMWMTGLSGLIGYITNYLAVKMIFHSFTITLGPISLTLPGSGLIPRNRDRILDTIAEEVRRRLITPEALERIVSEEDLIEALAPTIQREVMRLILKRESLKTVLNAMSKPLEEYFRGREFRALLKQQVERMEEEHLLIGLASRFKIIDADEIAKWIGDLVWERWRDFSQGEEGLSELQRQVASVLREMSFQEDQAAELLGRSFRRIINKALREIDFGAVARRSLVSIDEGNLEDYLEFLSQRYLNWIEIWGGVMGALVGIVMWLGMWIQ